MSGHSIARYGAGEQRSVMPKPTLYFFCPDVSHPLGGIKQTSRHVDVLNANGFDAWIVHRQKGFKIEWFEHDTRVMYEPAPVRKISMSASFPKSGARTSASGAKISAASSSIK